MPNKRRSAGDAAEAAAGAFFVTNCYQILARNFIAPGGEIDLIAFGDGCLVFAEVKLRRPGGMVSGNEAVTPAKQKRIIAAAHAYIAMYRPEEQIRYDVITVYRNAGGEYCVGEHIPDAFRED
ncbi:MAG: YraN family protein [Oscillospiraceae bacterium]|jgi:putative endonuclease|nr:YraN family protein [Oscillospiraceae bacterium]